MTTTRLTVPRWAPPAAVSLAAAGLAISTYLAIEHVTAPGTLACPATATVDCVRVTTSEQAWVFGIPVAFLGVVYFLAALAACWPSTWSSTNPVLRRGRVGLVAGGAAFVVYLIYAELFLVEAVCLWCTAVHLIGLALFGVVAMATAAMPSRPTTVG